MCDAVDVTKYCSCWKKVLSDGFGLTALETRVDDAHNIKKKY